MKASQYQDMLVERTSTLASEFAIPESVISNSYLDTPPASVVPSHDRDWKGDDLVRFKINEIIANSEKGSSKFKEDFFKDFQTWKEDPSTFLQKIRMRLSKFQQYVIQEYRRKLMAILTENNPGRIRHETLKYLEIVISECMEQIFLRPIILDITEIVESDTDKITKHITENIYHMRNQPQSYFNIRPKVQGKYTVALSRLRKLNNRSLPMEKLNCLVDCAHAVHGEKPNIHMTGDDLLSVVIWLIIRASKISSKDSAVVTQRDLVLMTELGDPQVATNGEHGYCLTVFTTAIQWISKYHPTRFERRRLAAKYAQQIGFASKW